MLGLVTLSCVYALAPNARQARLAVVLLALNPVFLFTSGSAVVEPLLTALLTAGALAAVRGKMKVAALLAVLACVTATKAWIWIAAVAGFAGFELVRRRAPLSRRWPAVAWAVPAIAVLVFLQLGFAPASHSVARGSLEVASATTRGSIPGGALARAGELALTYGRAALPLFLFGAIGLWTAIRRWPAGERATLRFLHFPALVYLAAVFGLVAIGAYTGSHRYLYPALPSLALLAAAALDRYAAIVRVVAVAATGLVAVAFIPAFLSFAADNAGLVAAGRAAAGNQGMLITDSPVVAYYSGRLPARIAGSQVLPADRQSAIAWMRAQNVDDFVIEGISYYRATALFPDLASGHAAAPFADLGEQAQYQVPGGKTVYGYRLGTALLTQSIYPGVNACIEASLGEGKTAGLAKGVILEIAANDAAGEGMGLGIPIVRYPDGWVYSRTATNIDVSTTSSTVWIRTYQLDEIGGDNAHNYSFVPIASRGAVEVKYTIDSAGVSIVVRPLWLAPGFTQVGILNEESAAFDDFEDVEWSVPAIGGAELHAGRELIPRDFNWAGLDYIFPSTFAGTAYHVNVQEAR